MGGLIVTALACERQLDVDVVAASGPALVLSPDISRVKLWLASILQRFIPRLAMSAGLDPNSLSTDQAVVRKYVADPLVHSQITASLAAGMTNAVRRLQGAAANLRLPMLILHGEADPICATKTPPVGLLTRASLFMPMTNSDTAVLPVNAVMSINSTIFSTM